MALLVAKYIILIGLYHIISKYQCVVSPLFPLFHDFTTGVFISSKTLYWVEQRCSNFNVLVRYRGLVKWYNNGLQNHCWEFDSLIPCHLRMKCSSDATFFIPWHGHRFKKVHSRGDVVPSWGLFKHFAMLVSFSSRFRPPSF